MLKSFRLVKGISIFLIYSIFGAIMLHYVEPIIFQESKLEPVIQVLIILGLLVVFTAGMIHMYFKSGTKRK